MARVWPSLLSALATFFLLQTSLSYELPPSHILWGADGPPPESSTGLATRDLELEDRDTACVNAPLTRNCWSSGYSVATDFDAKWPSTGKTVSVRLQNNNEAATY